MAVTMVVAGWVADCAAPALSPGRNGLGFEEDGGVFGTVGVSENIIAASWQALVEGIEYHLLHEAEKTKD